MLKVIFTFALCLLGASTVAIASTQSIDIPNTTIYPGSIKELSVSELPNEDNFYTVECDIKDTNTPNYLTTFVSFYIKNEPRRLYYYLDNKLVEFGKPQSIKTAGSQFSIPHVKQRDGAVLIYNLNFTDTLAVSNCRVKLEG